MKLKVGEEIRGGKAYFEKCPEIERRVVMRSDVWEKIMALTRELDTEWAGYLLGEIDDEEVYIDDLYVPEQEVTSASVEIKEDNVPDDVKGRIVGHVHSHGNMSAFFSGTDIEHLNYAVHLVVNKDEEYKCLLKIRAPCGRFVVNKDVEIEIEDREEILEFVDEVKERIKEKKYEYVSYYPYGYKIGKKGKVYPLRGYADEWWWD